MQLWSMENLVSEVQPLFTYGKPTNVLCFAAKFVGCVENRHYLYLVKCLLMVDKCEAKWSSGSSESGVLHFSDSCHMEFTWPIVEYLFQNPVCSLLVSMFKSFERRTIQDYPKEQRFLDLGNGAGMIGLQFLRSSESP